MAGTVNDLEDKHYDCHLCIDDSRVFCGRFQKQERANNFQQLNNAMPIEVEAIVERYYYAQGEGSEGF